MAKKGYKLSQAEVVARQQYNKIYYRVRNRINRVRAKFGETPAVRAFYDKKFSVKDKSLADIAKMTEQLRYIDTLGTSRIKNDRGTQENFAKYIQPLLDAYDNDRVTYNKIMYVYNRMVGEGTLYEKYKYNFLDTIARMTTSGFTTKQIMERIDEIYNELYEYNEMGRAEKYEFTFGGKVPFGRGYIHNN